MGIFSRKTIIQVSSVIYSMGEEPDKIPDMVKSSVIQARLREQEVPPAIRTSIIDGLGVKLSQAFSYASNNYYAGMPSGFPKDRDSQEVLDTLSRDFLEDEFPGTVVTLHASQVNLADDYETKMRELVAAEYDYDFFFGETLSTTGSVIDGASLAITGPFLDAVAQPDKIGYHLVFTNPDTSTVTIDKWYDAADFDTFEIIITRVLMDYSLDGGRTARYSYEYGGTSSLLNVFLRDLNPAFSGTFPAVVLKKNNIYLDDDDFSGTGPWHESEAYRSSKLYARRLGIGLDDILAQVKDNAQEGDIDFAFIQPGIRVNTVSEDGAKYLYNYFFRLYQLFPDNKPAWDTWKASADHGIIGAVVATVLAEGAPAQSVRFADPDNPESSVDMEIAWRYISYEEKSGALGVDFETECGIFEHVNARHTYSSTETNVEYETTKFYLRKKLTDSTYAELVVVGLRHENYVYTGHSVQSGLYDAFHDPDGDDGSGFLIPLDYTIYVTLSPRQRLQLAQEAVHMVFNCYVARKQKWYETEAFKWLMAIIAVVIIVFSWGTLAPQVTAIYNGFLLALAALGPTLAAALAAILTAAVYVGISAGIQYVAKEAGKWAAEHWGPAWGAVMQIAAVITLSYFGGQLFGSSLLWTPSSLADTAMYIGRQLLVGMAAYTQYTYAALDSEIKTWQDYAMGDNNPQKKLEELWADMFPDLGLIQQAALPQPEDLSEFLGRTLSSVDGLTNKLFLPIYEMPELTLTPRL